MTVDTAELRRLLAEATPGPWRTEVGGQVWSWVRPNGRRFVATTRYRTHPEDAPNAALIVAAVNALPGLLDRIEELEAENALLREPGGWAKVVSRDALAALDEEEK